MQILRITAPIILIGICIYLSNLEARIQDLEVSEPPENEKVPNHTEKYWKDGVEGYYTDYRKWYTPTMMRQRRNGYIRRFAMCMFVLTATFIICYFCS